MIQLYYLLSFGLILLFAYWVFRVIMRRDYSRRGRASIISPFLEMLVCVAFMAYPYTYLPADWYLLPLNNTPQPLRFIAYGLILEGIVLTLYAMFYVLGIRRAMGWQVDNLVDTGPYRISRNPQIVSFTLIILGLVVYWPTWYQAGWLVLYVLVFHMMVITEEEHLANFFGDLYKDYCHRVPRYIGMPKKRQV